MGSYEDYWRLNPSPDDVYVLRLRFSEDDGADFHLPGNYRILELVELVGRYITGPGDKNVDENQSDSNGYSIRGVTYLEWDGGTDIEIVLTWSQTLQKDDEWCPTWPCLDGEDVVGIINSSTFPFPAVAAWWQVLTGPELEKKVPGQKSDPKKFWKQQPALWDADYGKTESFGAGLGIHRGYADAFDPKPLPPVKPGGGTVTKPPTDKKPPPPPTEAKYYQQDWFWWGLGGLAVLGAVQVFQSMPKKSTRKRKR
jgi:hypothetical protein